MYDSKYFRTKKSYVKHNNFIRLCNGRQREAGIIPPAKSIFWKHSR